MRWWADVLAMICGLLITNHAEPVKIQKLQDKDTPNPNLCF
jgi:hypothetical protein